MLYFVIGVDIKNEIKTTIKTAFNKSEIEKEIYNKLDPSEKNPGRFYQIFKVQYWLTQQSTSFVFHYY